MAVKMAVGMAAEGEGIKGGLGPSMYLVFLLPRLVLRKPRVQSTRSYLAISSVNQSLLSHFKNTSIIQECGTQGSEAGLVDHLTECN